MCCQLQFTEQNPDSQSQRHQCYQKKLIMMNLNSWLQLKHCIEKASPQKLIGKIRMSHELQGASAEDVYKMSAFFNFLQNNFNTTPY